MELTLQTERVLNRWNHTACLARLENIAKMEYSITTINVLLDSSAELELQFRMIRTCFAQLDFIAKREQLSQLSAATVLSQQLEPKQKKNVQAAI